MKLDTQTAAFPDPDQIHLQPVRETPQGPINIGCSGDELEPKTVDEHVAKATYWRSIDRPDEAIDELISAIKILGGVTIANVKKPLKTGEYRSVGYSLNVVQPPF